MANDGGLADTEVIEQTDDFLGHLRQRIDAGIATRAVPAQIWHVHAKASRKLLGDAVPVAAVCGPPVQQDKRWSVDALRPVPSSYRSRARLLITWR